LYQWLPWCQPSTVVTPGTIAGLPDLAPDPHHPSKIDLDDELKDDEVLEPDERFAGEDEDHDDKFELRCLRERLTADQSTG